MANKKKSFVLHMDSLEVLSKLSDEQAGQLFKAIYAFEQGEELNLDFIVDIAFLPIKNQLLRDAEKYQKTVDRNKANGSKGGRPKTQNNPENPVGYLGKSEKPKKADNDSDNDSKSDSKKDRVTRETSLPNDFEITQEMMSWYNKPKNEHFLDIHKTTEAWIDAMKAKKHTAIDWTAKWRNGMRKAHEWAVKSNVSPMSAAPKRQANGFDTGFER